MIATGEGRSRLFGVRFLGQCAGLEDYRSHFTSADESQERKTVIAKFINIGAPQEMRFNFRRNGGSWLLDDVHSVLAPRWTLSEILQCAW